MQKIGTPANLEEANGSGASDAVLVEQTRQGDQEAFGHLVRRYETRLLRVVGRMLPDRELARDVAQEAFLRAYERLDQFDSARRFGPWLFRIAVNLCVDLLRRRRRKRLAVFTDSPSNKAPEAVARDPAPDSELAEEVRYLVDQIPLKYRTVLVLRDLEGFSCTEVAAIVNRREPTVRWRLAQAREMFRRLWLARWPAANPVDQCQSEDKVDRHESV